MSALAAMYGSPICTPASATRPASVATSSISGDVQTGVIKRASLSLPTGCSRRPWAARSQQGSNHHELQEPPSPVLHLFHRPIEPGIRHHHPGAALLRGAGPAVPAPARQRADLFLQG